MEVRPAPGAEAPGAEAPVPEEAAAGVRPGQEVVPRAQEVVRPVPEEAAAEVAEPEPHRAEPAAAAKEGAADCRSDHSRR